MLLGTFAACAIFLKSASSYDFNIYQYTTTNMRYLTEERIETHYKEIDLEGQETRSKYFVYNVYMIGRPVLSREISRQKR